MARRLTNLSLLFCVLGLVATGLAGWFLPFGDALPMFLVHRALGLGILIALALKVPIAYGSLRRRLGRDGSIAWGFATATAASIAVVLGVGWTLGGFSFETFGGYSAMNVHVFAGLALLGLMLLHALRRWEGAPSPSRRLVLRAVLMGVGAVALWRVGDAVASARRETGSKHAGSFSGNAFPVTQWTFDPVPLIDPDAWRIELRGALASPMLVDLRELEALLPRRSLQTVIDCTGGWWSEQVWTGFPLGELVAALGPAPSARQATIVSTTGHRWTFRLADLDDALLATAVGGEPLAPAHGAPVRLVVPGRRGVEWVKWVTRIEVS